MNKGMTALLALNLSLDGANGKHLYASLFGNGSVIIICAFVGVAVLAAVLVYLQKKKKDNNNNGKNDDE